MSITHSDPTRYFSVIGPAYIYERHAETDNSCATHGAVAGAEPSLTASWVALIAVVAGISVFAGEISVLFNVALTKDVMAAVIQ